MEHEQNIARNILFGRLGDSPRETNVAGDPANGDVTPAPRLSRTPGRQTISEATLQPGFYLCLRRFWT